MAWHNIRYSRVNFIESVNISGDWYKREILTGEDGGYDFEGCINPGSYFVSNNSTVSYLAEGYEEWRFDSFEELVKFSISQGSCEIELWGIEPDDYEACLDMGMEVYSCIEECVGFSTTPIRFLVAHNE